MKYEVALVLYRKKSAHTYKTNRFIVCLWLFVIVYEVNSTRTIKPSCHHNQRINLSVLDIIGDHQ